MTEDTTVVSGTNCASGSNPAADSGEGRGPGGRRTEHGKKIASQNARKHGLYSKTLPLDAHFFSKEERMAFETLLEGLAEDWKPVGMTERIQVELAALSVWQYWRLLRVQQVVLTAGRLPLSDLVDKAFEAEAARVSTEKRAGTQSGSYDDGLGEVEDVLKDSYGIDLALLETKEQESERLYKQFSGVPKEFLLQWLQKHEAHILRQYYRPLAELERFQRMRLGDGVPPRLVVEVNQN